MRILCTADWHIGHNLYGSIDIQTGYHSSSLELISSIRQMVKYAEDNEINHIIVAGDIFHRRNPSSTDWSVLCKVLSLFEQTSIYVYLMTGNHDDSMQYTTSLAPFDNLEHPHIKVIDTIIFSDAFPNILLLPHTSKRWTTNDAQKGLQNMIDSGQIMPSILICHESITGAKYNSLNTSIVAETGLNSKFLSKNFKLTIAGHFHAYQQIGKNIYYTGPLTHIDLNDWETIPGFLVVDTETYAVQHIPVKTRRFIQLSGNAEEIEESLQKMSAINSNDVLKIKIIDEYIKDMDTFTIRFGKYDIKLENLIIEFYPITKKISRNLEITYDQTPYYHLEQYVKMNNLDKNVLEIGKDILNNILEK